MFEGMPWSLLLPIATLFLVWGVMRSKLELAAEAKKEKKKSAKRKKK